MEWSEVGREVFSCRVNPQWQGLALAVDSERNLLAKAAVALIGPWRPFRGRPIGAIAIPATCRQRRSAKVRRVLELNRSVGAATPAGVVVFEGQQSDDGLLQVLVVLTLLAKQPLREGVNIGDWDR